MKQEVITKVKRVIKEIYLLKEEKHTTRDLAELFNVSYKTIQRDIKDIESLGIGKLEKEKRVYKFVDTLKPKVKVKSTITITKDEKNITTKEETLYSEITKNSGIIKKDKADNYFYYIKNTNNQIIYISDKFDNKAKAKNDLMLAL